MKKFIIPVLLAAFAAIGHSEEDPIAVSEAMFKANHYKEGMVSLKNALNKKHIGTETRAKILNRLARCFEVFTGDIEQASGYYRRALSTELPADHPSKVRARLELNRLKDLEQKYTGVNKVFDKIRNVSFRMKQEFQIKEQITEMKAIADANPDYYRLSEVFFMLGMYHFALRQYKEAYESMDKSMELKPGIYLRFPVKTRREEAFGYYHRIRTYNNYTRITNLTLALLSGITLIVVLRSCPWKWIRPGQVIAGILIIIAWPCVFYSGLMILENYTNPRKILRTEALAGKEKASASGSEVKRAINSLILSNKNFDVHTRPTETGGSVVTILCGYGLAGVGCLFLFSTGIGRLKTRTAAFLINFLFAAILFAALTTDFYFRYCYAESSLYGKRLKANIVYYINVKSF